MLHKSLLPHKYKGIGWSLLIPATIVGVILTVTGLDTLAFKAKVFAFSNGQILEHSETFNFIRTNVTPTLVGIAFIAGGLLVAFISNLRLSSLLWALLANYVILVFCLVFIYGTSFLTVMVYNMFTVIIIFIARFNYVLWRNSNAISDEKHH